ncbi:DNA mismatch repair protein MutS [bacterium]|nr:DNA mismatch repair protein MutS [candidate division CSSED10-310 bacterium]
MTSDPLRNTPMMRQYHTAKSEYPDAILFFRMGDFYEMFGDDAVKAAPILDVVLTSRDKNAEDRIPMCGVPHHSVNTYVARLIEKNMKVAICEQLEDPRTAKGIVKRGVTRLITPGTVLEENLLSSRENNFIASIYPSKNGFGLAFLDMSTGEFHTTEVADLSVLIDEVDRWTVREIVHPDSWKHTLTGTAYRFSPQDDWTFSEDASTEQLRTLFHVTQLDGLGLSESPLAIRAAGALIHYVRGTQLETLNHITRLRVYHDSQFVHIDAASRRNLEISRTLMGNTREGSLLHYIDLTVTAMGSRLLKLRLEQPLRSKDAINQRLDQLDAFYSSPGIRMSLRDQLMTIADLERLMSRVVTGIAHPRDLSALRSSLQQLPAIRLKLQNTENSTLSKMADSLDPMDSVREYLESALTDNPPATIKEGGFIRDGYHCELDTLRSASRDGKKWIASLQNRERSRSGIGSLKVRYNKVFGYFIEITKTHLEKVPDDYIRKQTLVNAERYITQDLKEMEEKILGAEDRMIALEQDLFRQIRTDIGREVSRIMTTAQGIAEIDVAAAAAELASANRYRRPVIEDSCLLDIRNGRHPVVERIPMDRGFVPNDTRLDGDDHRLVILTGPNMAGKSTFIRQVALIVLMAQAGLFVPADEAVVGLVDRIFTRVGASDNLAGGQSTFMVEMSEAANILNNASDHSLVILDEIGRGTSTFDGLSIAWAVAEYLHKKRCRTLFATHYHELTDLRDRLEGVQNYNVVVKEWNDQVMFLRKVVPGAVDRSYGIQVARLAGLPHEVLERAKEVLNSLEMKEQGRVPVSIAERENRGRTPVQLSLFSGGDILLQRALDKIDINQLTPIEALNTLSRWKKEFGRSSETEIPGSRPRKK